MKGMHDWVKNLIIKILMKINIIILKLIAVFSSKNIIEIKEESIKNIIVFAPHADDESIGCAGIIKKHSLEGSNIIIVNMTDGKSSKSNLDKEKLAELRKKELLNVANKLCVKQVISLDFQDGNLQCGEDEILTVRNLISEYKPDIIYTPFFCDTHKDHVTTNLILINALKETGYECQIRAFEVQTPMTSMIFNSFYEISFFTETKKQLLLS
ncbi:MAG: PIG-L family deacetylase, partial [Bacillota bacterium]|nr:PIG-L family deacetylase [Bacillota bacterium]